MDQAATATARHHIYILLSRLYLDGLTDSLRPFIAEIPELASAAPQSFNRDEEAANHYQLFAHDIFPYESIFRDQSGLLGGRYADDVRSSYQHAAIQFSAGSDHIGHELAFLAALCAAEANGIQHLRRERCDHFKRLQGEFLREHLLVWLAPFVTSISNSGDPFFTAVSQVTQNVVFDHLLAVGEAAAADPLKIIDEPESQNLLLNEQTSLKQIAGFLITPPFSGLYLSRSTISRLAKQRQLPRGFGSREQMLSNLFRSAAEYDLVPDLLQDLADFAGSWIQSYQIQSTDYPEMSPWIRPWLRRAENSTRMMSDMRQLSIAAD